MLRKNSVLNFEIELLSGLHIGGYDSAFDIGGADSTVIRNPLTNVPFIPGSSFKGKLRSLLSYSNEYGEAKGSNIVIKDDIVRNIFEPVSKNEGNVEVSRAIFRDLSLTEDSKRLLSDTLGTGIYTEIKAENSIDKFKGTSNSPRFIERIPAGVTFSGEIVLQVFEQDDEEKMKTAIEYGLKLLEMNYLGGSGTRGYGRIKILSKDWTDENI